MSHFNKKFFLDNRFFNVDWVLNWNLDRHLNNFLNFNWLVNVNRFIDVYGGFYYFWSWHFNCFHNFFDYFNRNFLLNINIFGDLHYFLDHSFRAWNRFRNFHNDLNWFFHNDLFDNLFRNSTIELTYFIFSLSK